MRRGEFLATAGLLTALPGIAWAGEVATLAPVLGGSTWLNARVDARNLRGKVVLVDVFTFECINCVRVTPNLQRLYREYGRDRLEIIGVHTPEVPSYQGRIAYLKAQIARASIEWPIVVDNDYAIWNAYGVSAWPTQLVFDRSGTLRATIVGDSQDAEVDAAIAKIIK